MQYTGELISILVAFLWTIAAMASQIGSKHLGVVVMNVWRMSLALVLSCLLSWVLLGDFFPWHASSQAWIWLLGSGVVGYFFGDWCLFNSYLTIGSRYGQLFMTLAPMFTAFAAWAMIGQTLSWSALLAMAVTLFGIAISVLNRGGKGRTVALKLPPKGVLYGIGAGLGQGLGLVLSKIGLDYYTRDVALAGLSGVDDYLPFSANSVRCMAGLCCFFAWLVVRKGLPSLRQSVHDGRGLAAMVVAVLSGPFIGVGLSLLAVQYVEAGVGATLMAITPIIILWPSHKLFGEEITLKGVLGAVISVVGVSLFFLL